MRTEKEMMALILDIAQNDERIRAAYMQGSRTNPNVPKDILQDYDVVYVVKETAPFINDRDWIKKFGEILFMQYPDEFPEPSVDRENSYGWLMVFTDGNRIDLTIKLLAYAEEDVQSDSLTRILLDKDGSLPKIPESSDSSYHVKRPSEVQFTGTCNEFWWCLNNIAKGLWRKEPTYVLEMMNSVVRKQLETMLAWKAGILTDFSVSAGKAGKYLYRFLSEDEWQRYLDTFSGAGIPELWQSVETMCALFLEESRWVAAKLGFMLNEEEARNSLLYLHKIKELPEDAEEIF